MCNDETIKELLPAYREQVLDPLEKLTVVSHLASCDDCRTELALLSMMAEETVPDPGEAFWAAMPDRVSQAVQKSQTKRKTFDLSWLLSRMTLPRWTWAAATMGTVLIISWFFVMPLQNRMEMPQSQGNEFADETAATGSVSVADLDNNELSTIDSWAGSELASIAQEAEPVLGNGRDVDIYEELEALNAGEIKRLSKMLEQVRQEG
ncbi:MAG: zf-HC2 domain-containing protein [Nitrospirae bacterium]|nr:zf-HC2 domain-containing protein [Nitrospirota bacterium]